MAIVINPDGTVSTIETTHDQYGNIKPKIDSKAMKEQEIHHNRNIISETKEKSGSIHPTNSASKVYKKKVKVSRAISPQKQKALISFAEIDMFFKDKIASGKRVSIDEYERIKNSLPENLKRYFASKYHVYLGWLKPKKKPKRRTTFKKPKEQIKAVNKKKTVHEDKAAKKHHSSYNGNSIGEIAKFGSLKAKYASSSDYDVRTSDPPRPARPPKYAYARDRYGRVQERDSFNEEKKNEFYAAQNSQRNYDYSSYDANDDHDGAYSGWE
jgi:hypothetical protein